nr:interferon-induced gtp-binding protein mx1 [Quercus suber]
MGLTNGGDTGEAKSTFSNDVLRLVVSGPSQEHLSVVDVPGIFKSTTAGLTTKADITLVKDMVLTYMRNPRSIMLAVVPANVDVATQEILELAADVDPKGDRTLGVLTKPDLVDKGAEAGVIDLLEGRKQKMKLGWHVVRNPGQQQLSDLNLQRGNLEMNFFRSEVPWAGVEKDKVGVEALRSRLKEVLSSLIKTEFPRKRLKGLGAERSSTAAQAAFLTEVASNFQRLVTLALNVSHGADDAFNAQPALRIAPAVKVRMEQFSLDMAQFGHTYSFPSHGEPISASEPTPPTINESISHDGAKDKKEQDDDVASEAFLKIVKGDAFNVRKKEDTEDLTDILQPPTILFLANPSGIEKWLREIYHEN